MVAKNAKTIYCSDPLNSYIQTVNKLFWNLLNLNLQLFIIKNKATCHFLAVTNSVL